MTAASKLQPGQNKRKLLLLLFALFDSQRSCTFVSPGRSRSPSSLYGSVIRLWSCTVVLWKRSKNESFSFVSFCAILAQQYPVVMCCIYSSTGEKWHPPWLGICQRAIAYSVFPSKKFARFALQTFSLSRSPMYKRRAESPSPSISISFKVWTKRQSISSLE